MDDEFIIVREKMEITVLLAEATKSFLVQQQCSGIDSKYFSGVKQLLFMLKYFVPGSKW
jgi:hypothetical protein